MKSVVIDASMAAAWLLPDERTDATDATLAALSGFQKLVPSIFWHEIRNILVLAERRGRIDADRARGLLASIDLLNLQDGGHAFASDVLGLARAHTLTAYDAAYLELALSLNCPLATLDKKLAAAGRREGVTILGPLAP